MPHRGPSFPVQAGVASGPQGLNLLSPAAVAALAPVVHACLSLIALAAGAELHLPELRRLRRQVGGWRCSGARLQLQTACSRAPAAGL